MATTSAAAEPPMADLSAQAAGGGAVAASPRVPRYAYYVLTLLILANFFNYLDRHIVSALAQRMSADLKLSDAQLGFLLGTAFATLYGVLGIAMGRIADQLSRTRLMAAGLALWSAMTAMSGLAVNFASVAAARIGVGVGEAAANPCSHSLLSDYFPPRNRGVALGAYLASVHLGIGGSLILGGLILQKWPQLCTALPGNACAIADWRGAFMLVGLPGIILAVLIFFMRDPPRPQLRTASPLKIVIREISTSVPPFTLLNVHAAGGSRAAFKNLAFALLIGGIASAIAAATGDWAQWIAVAVGAYSVSTWAQVLHHRDPALFSLTFGCKTFLCAMFGGGFVACFTGTVGTWSAPYAIRTLGASAGEAGLALGLTTFIGAGLSVIVGGFITDRWKQRDRRAPIFIALIALFGPIPMLVGMLMAETLGTFIAFFAAFTFLSMSWAGAFAALVMDLVLVRMRGAASAIFSLMMMLIASGIGPYWAGKISTITGSLTTGLYSLLALVPVAATLLIIAASRLRHETPEGRLAMAQAAGEPA